MVRNSTKSASVNTWYNSFFFVFRYSEIVKFNLFLENKYMLQFKKKRNYQQQLPAAVSLLYTNYLLTGASFLSGLRLQVYRAEGTTQWYTAVTTGYNTSSQV